MSRPLIGLSDGPPGVPYFLMEYIEGFAGTPITIAGTSSISYTAYKAGTSTILDSGSIDKSTTVFDSPVSNDPRWKPSDKLAYPAYNFGWRVPPSAAPSGLEKVRLVIIGVEAGADANTWMIVHDRTPTNIGLTSTTPNLITSRRGDRLSVSLPLLGNISARSKLWWTAKRSLSHPDDEAILALTEAGGLVRLNGEAAADSSKGSLTVDNATTGAVTLYVHESVMATLDPVHALFWDCQFKAASVLSTPKRGQFTVLPDVTQATS